MYTQLTLRRVDKRETSTVSATVLACAASAQEFRGSVAGTITDQSGSPVPDARVRITNVATNVTSETQSTDAGRYSVGFLQPGTYNVSAEKTGFKKTLQ